MIIQTWDNSSLDESGGSEKWLDSVCILKVGLKDLMLNLKTISKIRQSPEKYNNVKPRVCGFNTTFKIKYT